MVRVWVRLPVAAIDTCQFALLSPFEADVQQMHCGGFHFLFFFFPVWCPFAHMTSGCEQSFFAAATQSEDDVNVVPRLFS